MSVDWDLPVHDFFEILDLGLARGANLLTAGELSVVRRMRALVDEQARVFARLSGRKRKVFAVDRLEFAGVADCGVAVDALVDAGLLTRFVPWPGRLEVLTVDELKAACRREKLRVGGRRDALVERVEGLRVGREREVVSLCHVGLIRRLERFALGRIYADRSQWVVERLGMVRWAEYKRTLGVALFPTRRDLLRWEAVLAAEHPVEDALALLEDPTRVWPPGRLDPRRRLRRSIFEAIRTIEREGAFGRAEALYKRLALWLPAGSAAVRLSRVIEHQGRGTEALWVLQEARSEARLGDRIASERAGRRVAKSLGLAWAPSRPLLVPKERRLRLSPAPAEGGRPRWEGGLAVEEAVASRLIASGRRVLTAEGPLWRTLFALLFAETYFLPVPGQLPVPFLSGPLDLATPQFRERRADAVATVLAGVRAGEAGDRLGVAVQHWWGVRLSGARWDLATPEELIALGSGFKPAALAALLEHLLDEGLRAAAGLPDLVVLAGDAVRLGDAHPSRVGQGVLLVEVKGPSDSLRDEQRAWNHRLLSAGATVEVWNVRS
ncbi:MAG: VRR-NUC domain-containing protein [Proteobacteria bacterium]|nr:VRR-NUC domain-containing protein [Pseudomonadota bacterium]